MVRLIPPLLPAFFALISMAASAQRSGLGLKAGLGAAHTRSGAMNGRYTSGATVGLYAPLLAAPRFELQPEVLLTALGSGYAGSEGERLMVRSVYVQVPLMAKVYVGSTLNLQGGLLAAKLINATQYTDKGEQDVTSGHRPDEIALLLGAGLDLPSGLDLTFRYHNGLTPVLANDNVLFPRNQALLMSVGYRMLAFKAPSTQRRRR
ncbi:MAG: PorT family protein [Flavobacteriales bacterium]|nr:PorT family protein [Flavobacteriales bacterium]